MADLFGPEALARYLQQTPDQGPQQPPKKETAGVGPYAAIAGSNAADILTSLLGRGKEANPANFDTTALVMNKLMSTLIPMLLVKYLSDSGHPTAAKIAGYGASVAPAVAAIHNTQVK